MELAVAKKEEYDSSDNNNIIDITDIDRILDRGEKEMSDYIKRDDAIHGLWRALYAYQDEMERKFQTDPDVKFDDWFIHRIFVQGVHAKCLEEVCDNIPSADVVERKDYESMERTVLKLTDAVAETERKKGEWIDKVKYAICSECGCISSTQFDGVEPIPYKSNFCLWCGADMRGEANEKVEGSER